MTRFFEFTKEEIKASYERIESEGLRAGTRVLRADRWVPNAKGAAGGIELEVVDRGFGWWLGHMLGTVTVSKAAGGLTPFTAVPGSLAGRSFTVQVGRPSTNGDMNPYTYPGGKVAGWEFSNEVDGVLALSLELDFASEHVPTPGDAPPFVAVPPVYPEGARLFTYVSGVVKVAGVVFDASEISIKAENSLKDDRWSIGGRKREPLEESLREIGFELKADFTDADMSRRVASATAAGALASLEMVWESVPLEPGGKAPSITVTIPAARFDKDEANIGGLKLPERQVQGKAVFDGKNPPITITYSSADTAL